MIDWNLVAKIAGGTWGVTILVCAIAWLVAWIVGLILQKTRRERKENSSKDSE